MKKPNKHTIIIVAVIISFVGIAFSAASFMISYHAVDLSVNMLAIKGVDAWWTSRDALDATIIPGTSNYSYRSMPYPAIYIKGFYGMIFSFAMCFLWSFLFGMCVMYLFNSLKHRDITS